RAGRSGVRSCRCVFPIRFPGARFGMRRLPLTLVISIAAAVMLAAASAQTPAPGLAGVSPADSAPKPYRPVAMTRRPAVDEPGFQSFRTELAGMLRKRVYPYLSRFVVAHGFFWDGDFDGELDPLRSGAENLANAVKLERGAGSGWKRLLGFAGEASAAPLPS